MAVTTIVQPNTAQELPSAVTWVVPSACARGINVASFYEAGTKASCCLCINTPLLSVGEYMMISLTINAHEYASTVGAWKTQAFGFLATGSGGALNTSYSHLGNRVRTVRWAVNPSGYWCLLLGAGTGATLTDSWVHPHISVDAMLAYGLPVITNTDLTSGWSITFPTDITSYTGLTTVTRNEA